MKIDLEYNELLHVTNALRARATVFERLGDEGLPPSIEYWHGEAANHRALADKILDQVAAAR